MNRLHTMAGAFLLLVTAVDTPANASDIHSLRAPKHFDYSTHRSVPVTIQVSARENPVSAISFFTRYGTVPKLMETVLTNRNGTYQGMLTIPSSTRYVIVSVRNGNTLKELKLSGMARHIVRRFIF